MSKTPPNTVASTGTQAGDVVVGIHTKGNFGLLIQVSEAQRSGSGGRIRGPFLVLHEGMGKYASGIRAVIESNSFFGKAEDFIRLVSKQDGCRDCTHVLNANALWKLDVGLIYDRIINAETPNRETEEIKRCLSCGQIYHDLSLNFCLDDGSPLSDELDEVETVVRSGADRGYPGSANSQTAVSSSTNRKRPQKSSPGYEYIRAAVAKHPNLELKVHQGFNHRIIKAGHTGSIWIIPRHGGVSITANGQAAQQLYREMERLLGPHHREDVKGYRYFQANKPIDVEKIIEAWAGI